MLLTSAKLLTPRPCKFRTVLTTARVRTFTSKTLAHKNQPGHGRSTGRQKQIMSIFLSEGWMSKAGPDHYPDCPMTVALLSPQWCELSPPALPSAPTSLRQRPRRGHPDWHVGLRHQVRASCGQEPVAWPCRLVPWLWVATRPHSLLLTIALRVMSASPVSPHAPGLSRWQEWAATPWPGLGQRQVDEARPANRTSAEQSELSLHTWAEASSGSWEGGAR